MDELIVDEYKVSEIKYVPLEISKESKIYYVDKLTNKVFKILPIIEENGKEKADIYMWGLLTDLNSTDFLFHGILIELITGLYSVYTGNMTYSENRRIIFNCINIVKKIKENLEKE